MNNKTVRFGSVCSGVECASLASKDLGWTPAWFSEIDDFPSAVLAHHFPDVPNLGDMTTIAERIRSGEVEAPELLVGGTPCFTAGHLVLTKEGYKPIEDIKVGDWVMTHKGRLRRVLRIGSKLAEVGELSMVGRSPIVCTPNHPFLVLYYKKKQKYDRTLKKRIYVETCTNPYFEYAENCKNLQYTSRLDYDNEIITLPKTKHLITDENIMYVIGLFLGDGYIVKKNDSVRGIRLTLNPEKIKKIKEQTGVNFTISKDNRITIYSQELGNFILKHFGEYSNQKYIPTWVYSHPYRSFLLDGYLDTDGTFPSVGHWQAHTISSKLAHGIADLAQTLGFNSSVIKYPARYTTGLKSASNFSDFYIINTFKRDYSRCYRIRHNFLCRRIKDYKLLNKNEKVYNLEVDEDNTYIVNGIITHNCQAFSLSGLRRSLNDERGNLTLEYFKLLDTIDEQRAKLGQLPAISVWENVSGVLSTHDNAFGCFLSGLVGLDFPVNPPDGRKFPKSGYLVGPKRSCAWRLLNSEYFGSAQSRPRIYVVASAREGFDPRKVLFELSGVRGNHKPSRKKGKTASTTPTAGFGNYDQGTTGTRGTRGTDPDEIARKHLVVLNDQGGSVMSVSGDGTVGTLRAETHAHEPIVTETIPLVDEKIGTLTACDLVKMPSNQSVANGLMFPELSVFENHRQDARYREMSNGKMPTLVAHMGTGGGNVPFVVEKNIRLFNMQPIESNMHNAGREIEKTPTLTATDPNPNKNQGGVCIVELEGKPYRLRVRKLLPIECERLMGMPDNWTLIPYRGKDVEFCPDSPRYKACGNGWSVETITWIFNRLDRELHGKKQEEETN